MSEPNLPNDNPFAPPSIPADQSQLPSLPTTPGHLGGTPPPPPGPPQDPGSSSARTWAWVAVAILLPIVVALQQLQTYMLSAVPAETIEEILPPKALDPFTSSAKPILKLNHFMPSDGSTPSMMDMMTESLDEAAYSPADRVRLAITQWQLDQPEQAQETLDDLVLAIETDDIIHPDIQIVSDLLAGEPLPSQQAQDEFIARHGWFADLALARDDETRHDELLAGGLAMIIIFAILGFGILVVLIAGLVLLIIGLIRMNSGKMPRRFEPPTTGGSVYLEMLPVFIAGFLFLQILGGIAAFALGEENGMIAALALQWLLLGVIAWPLVRGVPWERVKQDLGLYAPNGILKEVGAGALFYVASLPIYFFVAFVAAMLMFLIEFIKSGANAGGPPAAPPTNPMVDLVSGASPLLLIMFALLAIVWAPLMEELVFRGGVFRHLRSKLHWVWAAIIVALFFGLMHQYHPVQLIPVMALGFIFGVMREWRGSVIPAMTAHFIHNFTVFLILTVVLGFALN